MRKIGIIFSCVFCISASLFLISCRIFGKTLKPAAAGTEVPSALERNAMELLLPLRQRGMACSSVFGHSFRPVVQLRLLLVLCIFAFGFAAGESPVKASELKLADGDAGPILLSHLKRNVVIIAFIDPTCAPCAVECERIETVVNEFKSRGVRAYALAFGDGVTASSIKSIVSEHHISYPVSMTTEGQVRSYLHYDDRFAVPQVVIVDKQGNIRARSHVVKPDELLELWSLRALIAGLVQ